MSAFAHPGTGRQAGRQVRMRVGLARVVWEATHLHSSWCAASSMNRSATAAWKPSMPYPLPIWVVVVVVVVGDRTLHEHT